MNDRMENNTAQDVTFDQERFEPVSYTHLDVYKRQAGDSRCALAPPADR